MEQQKPTVEQVLTHFFAFKNPKGCSDHHLDEAHSDTTTLCHFLNYLLDAQPSLLDWLRFIHEGAVFTIDYNRSIGLNVKDKIDLLVNISEFFAMMLNYRNTLDELTDEKARLLEFLEEAVEAADEECLQRMERSKTI